MIGAFTFEEGGRTYRCAIEERKTEPAGRWWWFSVSHDPQRYAPFEAVAGDTESSVRSRIVAYYEHRLWVRAQPPAPRERFSGPGRPPNAAKKAAQGQAQAQAQVRQAPKR
jgi:hypothetical protein